MLRVSIAGGTCLGSPLTVTGENKNCPLRIGR